MIEKLKNKWQIESNTQFWVIILVFALTGSATVFVRKPVFALLGIDAQTPFWLKTIVYLLTVLPAYQLLLILIGSIFGQFQFFWEFEKKMLRRMRLLRSES